MNFRAYLAELTGTFTLTFIGAGAIISCGGQNLVVIAFAHGLALAMVVYATGHISGAHINPAVTIGMLVTGRIKLPDAVGHIVAQLLGATLAALLLKSLLPSDQVAAVKLGATLGTPENMAALGEIKTLVIEIFLTFLLVTTIFAVAVDERGPKNVYGFAIGLTVTFDILFAGPLTGASMNPARSFGPAVVGGYWDIHWVYWAAPIIGSVAAALVFSVVYLAKSEPSAS